MERKGVLESFNSTTYGEAGVGDPFDAMQKALPDLREKEEEETAEPEKPSVPKPAAPVAQTPPAQPAPQAQDDEDEDSGSVPMPKILANWLKNSEGIEVDVKDDDTVNSVFKKAYDKAVGDPNKLAEQYALRNGWTKEALETAKMLDSGMLKNEEQERYNELSRYSKFKFDITEETSDGDREAKIDEAKKIITNYYESTLSGKAKQKAIDSIDEYAEDFEDILGESIKIAGAQKESIKQGVLSRVDAADAKMDTHTENIKKAIQAKQVFGDLPDDVVKRQLDDLFEETETITYEDGTTDRVSKYTKNLLELQIDPIKAAKIMLAIAEGSNMKTAIEIGKGKFGNELEEQIRGAINNRDIKKFVPKSPFKGKMELLESKTY